jgi:hypothetical protein
MREFVHGFHHDEPIPFAHGGVDPGTFSNQEKLFSRTETHSQGKYSA